MRRRYIVYWADNTATQLIMSRRGNISIADYQRIAREGKKAKGCSPTGIHRYPL